MDCKTARLLLEYARPAAAELDAAEARALEEHLAGCEGCDQLARAERRADEAVGKAMRRVDVPDQLRQRVTARLREGRGEVRRRRITVGLCGAAAIAAALLLTLGAWRWFFPRPNFPAEAMLTRAQERVFAPPTPRDVKAAFASQGVDVTPPADLNYAYLRWMFLAKVEGRPTPMLMFNNPNGDATTPPRQHAIVFLISDGQFNLDAPLPKSPVAGLGYEYKCVTAVQQSEGKRYAYVVYFTGDSWDWLQNHGAPPEAANGN